MERPFNPTKKRGYTLIELVVVLAVIAVISAATLPNLTLSSDQQRLLASANTIRQILLDARTRSLAPSKSDSTGNYQIFQVGFTPFPKQADGTGEDTNHFMGNEGTRTVYMEKAVGACDQEVDASSPTRLRTSTLQRNVYVKRFYPAQGQNEDNNTSAIIRFSVGKVGFVCGGVNNPNFTSTNYNTDTSWGGVSKGNEKTIARNLYIELSTKAGRKMYIVVDRQTGETTVTRTNPQSDFTATTDKEAPKWSQEVTTTASINCSTNYSVVTLAFTRAYDYSSGAEDRNLPVYYDIKMDNQILALQYYSAAPASQPEVQFVFVTDTISKTIVPPSGLQFVVTALDQSGNAQPGPSQPYVYDAAKSFVATPILKCDTTPTGGGDDGIFPQDGSEDVSCAQEGQITYYRTPSIFSKITRIIRNGFLPERASAVSEDVNPACVSGAVPQ